MNKDSIMQFVGFVTQLGLDEFTGQWEQYVKDFKAVPGGMVLQQETGAKSRYKYISQHEYREQDFSPEFLRAKHTDHFPERKIKVEQAGGYSPVQIECREYNDGVDVKAIAFISHRETGLDFYRELPYHYLNIYQAYYESCSYGHILEFFVPEAGVAELLKELKTRPAAEVAVYRECFVSQA